MSDPTFRSYDSAAAAQYAAHRISYSPQLYDHILSRHKYTGGDFDLLLDVGCGPGNATRDLAIHFDEATGTDPGEAMISAAKILGGKCKSGEEVKFVVCGAEDLSKIGDVEGKVDLLTAAMSVAKAHWFDMPRFWIEAAKVVKPGGTVALWTLSSSFAHPSTPNYEEVQKTLLKFERDILASYELPGNRLSREMYDALPLPWEVEPTVPEFPASHFTRDEFDREGVLTNGKTFFCNGEGGKKETLGEIEQGLGTASMVIRWREDQKNKGAKDVVKVLMRDLRQALGRQEWIERGSGTAMLLFKRI